MPALNGFRRCSLSPTELGAVSDLTVLPPPQAHISCSGSTLRHIRSKGDPGKPLSFQRMPKRSLEPPSELQWIHGDTPAQKNLPTPTNHPNLLLVFDAMVGVRRPTLRLWQVHPKRWLRTELLSQDLERQQRRWETQSGTWKQW